ncbi:hypothetical protein [Cesiribacter sp. SM1]|nr:hypothetical protein [Cesiribacter sp. SM1]
MAIWQEDEESLEKVLESIAMSNPAYEFQTVRNGYLAELKSIHLLIAR